MYSQVVFVCLFVFLKVLSVEIGSRCITPNGELATCQTLTSCNHIFLEVLSLDDAALKFAKSSQCHKSIEPLICCGNATSIDTDADFSNSTLFASKRECGLDKSYNRIIGGQLTELSDFPWMTLLGYKEAFSENLSFKCGGTLINKRYVLTAAHCIRIKPELGISLHIVRLGEWNVTSDKDCRGVGINRECADPVVDMLIEKQIAHPGYSQRNGNNDIGLLRLLSNIEYTNFIQPICMPFPRDLTEYTKHLTVTGWGATERGTSSSIKLKLELPLVSNTICQQRLSRIANITFNQMCAGGESAKDACQGDSGGPLMMFKEITPYDGQWYQEGIVSWGVGCGKNNYPAIYTRVSQYLIWIIDNMAEF